MRGAGHAPAGEGGGGGVVRACGVCQSWMRVVCVILCAFVNVCVHVCAWWDGGSEAGVEG